MAVRRAAGADVAEVLGVLDEAAAWLARRGIEQWPARFERASVEGPVSRGEMWLAVAGPRSLGTLQLAPADAAWEDDSLAAHYVHRLAVRREAPGLGRLLLGWAAAARSDGCGALRLRGRRRGAPPLLQTLGFERAGDTVVHGPPGARSASWPPVRASRYELRLGPAAEGVTRP